MDILIWPHTNLKKISEPVVEPLDSDLILRMTDTMLRAGGVGLAAIQVDIPKTFFLGQVNGRTEVFVNPTWSPSYGSNRTPVLEGCLSLPGIQERVLRHKIVDVTWQTPDLQTTKQATLFDLEAQIVQHETEHLRGMIYIDKTSFNARQRARKALFGRRTWNPCQPIDPLLDCR